MLRPALTAIVLFCLLLPDGGCGNSRTPAPDVSQPAQPSSFRTLRYVGSTVELGVKRRWSIQFGAPRNWSIVQRKPPVVTVVTSGNAVVALWRYRRTAPVPMGTTSDDRARQELLGVSRAHDHSIQIIASKTLKVRDDPAVELDALESIGGQRRRVRSIHVFVPRAEVVLDEYAPPSLFHSVDHAVFSPVKRSLRLSFPSITSG